MPAVAEFVWSDYQTALFNAVEAGRGSIVVEAVAGAAKTTSLVECAKRIDEWSSAAAVCFNVKIKDALVTKLPPSVPALTLNSLGNRAWKSFVGKFTPVDPQKITKLVRQISNDQNPEFRKGVKRLVDLAKMAGIAPTDVNLFPLLNDTDEAWYDLIQEYNVVFGYGEKEEAAIGTARRVLVASIQKASESINFNDQLYLPIVFGADFPKYDILFIDEAQDLSEIQRVMCERSVAVKGRIVAFGDPAQAIYGWRGAGKNAMAALRTKFDAVSLPLSISYRCSKAVVRKAQQFVPGIQFADWAVEGSVNENAEWTPSTFRSTDVILCRNNAPLVKMAFKLLRSNVACKIQGRDLASGLIGLVSKFSVYTIRELEEKLNKYAVAEAAKLADHPEQMTALYDRVDTLKVFIENASSPADVVVKIEALFSDEKGQYLTLSSIHRSKGLEWPRVFLLNPELIGARGMTPEEKNCYYVACTRAQIDLNFIRN